MDNHCHGASLSSAITGELIHQQSVYWARRYDPRVYWTGGPRPNDREREYRQQSHAVRLRAWRRDARAPILSIRLTILRTRFVAHCARVLL